MLLRCERQILTMSVNQMCRHSPENIMLPSGNWLYRLVKQYCRRAVVLQSINTVHVMREIFVKQSSLYQCSVELRSANCKNCKVWFTSFSCPLNHSVRPAPPCLKWEHLYLTRLSTYLQNFPLICHPVSVFSVQHYNSPTVCLTQCYKGVLVRCLAAAGDSAAKMHDYVQNKVKQQWLMVREVKRMNIDEAFRNNKATPHFTFFFMLKGKLWANVAFLC